MSDLEEKGKNRKIGLEAKDFSQNRTQRPKTGTMRLHADKRHAGHPVLTLWGIGSVHTKEDPSGGIHLFRRIIPLFLHSHDGPGLLRDELF